MARPTSRNVKGTLFADYVRMIRRHKGIDWTKILRAEDAAYIDERITPDAWYPMETFERLGNAILREVANLDLEAVRMWGRFSVDALRAQNPQLVAEDNPMESLMRFRVLRSTYFDFDALLVNTLVDDHARIVIHYYMGKMAEEAASYQTMGFFERLLEIAGARDVHAKFVTRSWHGDEETLLELVWTPP